MASVNDKITDVRNAARPRTAEATGTRSSGGTSLSCDSLTGWPTASKVHFVTYQIDSNSNPVSGTQLDCYGIVSGSTIGSIVVVDGTDNGNSIGDKVEMLPTAAWGQDLADALMEEHDRDGTHAATTHDSVSTDTIAEKTADTGVTVDGLNIKDSKLNTDNSVVAANITADAVTDAKLVYGKLRSRLGGSATNWGTAGTTTYDYSATNTFIQAGTNLSNASPTTITFPTAFNQVPIVVATLKTAVGANCYISLIAPTSTNFTCQVVTDAGAANTAQTISWIAIGE